MITRVLGLCVGAAVALTLAGRLESQATTGQTPIPDEATVLGLMNAGRQGKDIEITRELLEDFGIGLSREATLTEEFVKELSGWVKTVERYRACDHR